MTGNDLFIVGEVIGVHGLGGKLRIRSYADSIETFKPGINIKLKSSASEDGIWYEIASSSAHKKGILISLKGMENIDTAESLKGKEILIKRKDLPEQEDNTYFWQDLIGLEVLDNKIGIIGKIDNVFQTGANEVFVVKSGENRNEKEVLVPVIQSVIKAVNIKEGTIEIELPEGL